MALQVNQARPADLPEIKSMIEALSAFHGETANVTLARLQDIFFETPAQATALIARSGDATLGYAGLTSQIILHEDTLRIDIHHLFVKEAHRAKGIGRALITASKDYAREIGATRLTIGTDPENATAIASYRAMGLDEITGAGPRFRIPL